MAESRFALSQNFSDMVEHQPELLAYHLTAAGDNERAIALFERLDSAPEHLNVLYWLAVAHGLRGELSQAAEATEAGVALAEARGDRPALINSLRGAALAHLLTGHLAKALDRCQRAVAIFDASDEVEQRGSALRIEWR